MVNQSAAEVMDEVAPHSVEHIWVLALKLQQKWKQEVYPR